MWRTVLASAVIWVAILPLVAYHFDQVNPWAVPAGVLLLPLTAVALLGGASKIVLTLACPWLAGAWAAGAAAPAAALRHAVDGLARLPGAGVPVAPPPVWAIAAFYGLLAAPLFPWRRRGEVGRPVRRRSRRARRCWRCPCPCRRRARAGRPPLRATCG